MKFLIILSYLIGLSLFGKVGTNVSKLLKETDNITQLVFFVATYSIIIGMYLASPIFIKYLRTKREWYFKKNLFRLSGMCFFICMVMSIYWLTPIRYTIVSFLFNELTITILGLISGFFLLLSFGKANIWFLIF